MFQNMDVENCYLMNLPETFSNNYAFSEYNFKVTFGNNLLLSIIIIRR